MTNAEIAAIHSLSLNTVKSFIRSAYRSIGVTSPIASPAVLAYPHPEGGFRADFRGLR